MKTIQFLLAILFVIAGIAACGGGGYGSGGGGSPSYSYGISGTISGGLTNNSGVNVSLTGAATKNMTTVAGGAYSFGGLPNGTYTVTPSMPSATSFSPASATVYVYLNNPVVNFTEAP